MTFETHSVRHAYELVADEYTRTFGEELADNAFDRSVISAAFEELDAGARIMDVGCGPGQVAAYLEASGARTVALDLTPAMLDIARSRHPLLAAACGDVLALPIRPNSLDGAVAWFSLHNLPRDLLPGALHELRRVLVPGATLLIATHGGSGEETIEHEWRRQTESVVVTYFEPEELGAMLENHGYRVIAVQDRPPRANEHQVTKLFVTARATGD